jgi:predicted ester cyclase
MGERTIVALGAATVVFGRRPPPHTDFQLLDPLVAKEHFEIRWNARAVTHEVVDYGARFSPTLNDDVLRGECRALVLGDVLAIGQFSLRYIDLERPDDGAERVNQRNALRRQLATATDPESIVRAYFQALGSRDFERLLLLMSPYLRLLGSASAYGREDALAMLKRLFEAFPDWRFDLNEIWRFGNQTYVRLRMGGTYRRTVKGPIAACLPPIGTQLELPDQVFAFRVSDGCLETITWTSYDDALKSVSGNRIVEQRSRWARVVSALRVAIFAHKRL